MNPALMARMFPGGRPVYPAAGTLTYPFAAGSDALTVALRVTSLTGAGAALMYGLEGAAAHFALAGAAAGSYALFIGDTGNGISADGIGAGWVASSRHTLVGRGDWDTVTEFNYNGTNAASGGAASESHTLDAFTLSPEGAVYLDAVIISGQLKDADWTTAIQSSSGAAYNNLKRMWRVFAASGDMLIPYQGSIAWVKP